MENGEGKEEIFGRSCSSSSNGGGGIGIQRCIPLATLHDHTSREGGQRKEKGVFETLSLSLGYIDSEGAVRKRERERETLPFTGGRGETEGKKRGKEEAAGWILVDATHI